MDLKINDKIKVVSVFQADIKGVVKSINFLEKTVTMTVTSGKGGKLVVPFDRIRKI